MSLSDMVKRLQEANAAKPQQKPLVFSAHTPRAVMAHAFGGVEETDELIRIRDLPRRKRPVDAELETLAVKWSNLLRNESSISACTEPDCIHLLNPLQGWALEEFSFEGGLLAKMAVGSGKTGVDVLLSMVRPDVSTALLLLKPALVDQFVEVDYPRWAKHFRVPNLGGQYASKMVPGRPTLYVYSYSDLSTSKNSDILSVLQPDLIIADESQNLSSEKSSRTKRFIRYFQENELLANDGKAKRAMFVALTGSMATKGICDYGHHAALALRGNSPLPISPDTRRVWAKSLDPAQQKGFIAPAGALRTLCDGPEGVVAGVGRRVLETKGVVASEFSSVDTPLSVLTRRPPPMPVILREAFDVIRIDKTRPDGEEPDTPFRLAQWARQVACGFYYRWRFPRGESEDLINQWFARRKAWHREIRDQLELSNEVQLDSPFLLTNAAMRANDGYKGPLPVWKSEHYANWMEVKDKVAPVTSFVWLDNHMLDDAAAWAAEQKGGGIIWCEFSEFGNRLANKLGVPYYNGGDENSAALRAESGQRVVVCSIKGHGTGTNLQRFREHLVTGNPADGGAWEQLLGRSHRYGQTLPVTFYLYRHTEELRSALDKAYERAEWMYEHDKCDQKLLLAKKDW